MNAWEPTAPAREAGTEPEVFQISRPPADVTASALVFASPHSGRCYPADLIEASRLDAHALRRSEDAHVDDLIASAPAHGATVIAASLARAWFDVNREPWELDAAMFADDLPAYARARSTRVAAGLGSIARIVSDGQEIYRRKLRFAEAVARVEAVHKPYHQALHDLVVSAREAHGVAILIDWHSMPSAAVKGSGGRQGCDLVLGDRFGAACDPSLPRLVERTFQALGYRVARNAPYAGGYTTEFYGRPARRVHALQVEINRALYMDERTLAPTAGFAGLQKDLETVFSALAAQNWAAI